MIDAGIEALNREDYFYSIACYRVDALRFFVGFIIKGQMAVTTGICHCQDGYAVQWLISASKNY